MSQAPDDRYIKRKRPFSLGDTNNDGVVDIGDVILDLRCALGLSIESYQCLPCGDLNGSGYLRRNTDFTYGAGTGSASNVHLGANIRRIQKLI